MCACRVTCPTEEACALREGEVGERKLAKRLLDTEDMVFPAVQCSTQHWARSSEVKSCSECGLLCSTLTQHVRNYNLLVPFWSGATSRLDHQVLLHSHALQTLGELRGVARLIRGRNSSAKPLPLVTQTLLIEVSSVLDFTEKHLLRMRDEIMRRCAHLEKLRRDKPEATIAPE